MPALRLRSADRAESNAPFLTICTVNLLSRPRDPCVRRVSWPARARFPAGTSSWSTTFAIRMMASYNQPSIGRPFYCFFSSFFFALSMRSFFSLVEMSVPCEPALTFLSMYRSFPSLPM